MQPDLLADGEMGDIDGIPSFYLYGSFTDIEEYGLFILIDPKLTNNKEIVFKIYRQVVRRIFNELEVKQILITLDSFNNHHVECLQKLGFHEEVSHYKGFDGLKTFICNRKNFSFGN